jgi:chromosome segregation ATPase
MILAQVDPQIAEMLVNAPPNAMIFVLAIGIMLLAYFVAKQFLPLLVQLAAAFTSLSKSVEVLNTVVTRSMLDVQAISNRTYEAITDLGEKQDQTLQGVVQMFDETKAKIKNVEQLALTAANHAQKTHDNVETLRGKAREMADQITGDQKKMEQNHKEFLEALDRFQKSLQEFDEKRDKSLVELTSVVSSLRAELDSIKNVQGEASKTKTDLQLRIQQLEQQFSALQSDHDAMQGDGK